MYKIFNILTSCGDILESMDVLSNPNSRSLSQPLPIPVKSKLCEGDTWGTRCSSSPSCEPYKFLDCKASSPNIQIIIFIINLLKRSHSNTISCLEGGISFIFMEI